METSRGYIIVKDPTHPAAQKKGYVLQHRKVWVDAHGSIPDGMVVHHKNGDRKDNRLENLELHSRSSHMIEHYKNGFWFEPHNRGTGETVSLTCDLCGSTFVRMAREHRHAMKQWTKVFCSLQCSYASRKFRARGVTG